MIPLGEGTPSPVNRQKRKGLWSHHLDSKYWMASLLQLATGGHRVLPASHDRRREPFLLLTGHLIRDCKMVPLQGPGLMFLSPFPPLLSLAEPGHHQ